MSERHIPPRRERPALVKYAIAVASVAIAVIGALALGPHAAPGPLFFLAVILSAWFGGGRPGLLAAGLATLGNAYFFLRGTACSSMPPTGFHFSCSCCRPCSSAG